MGLSICSIRSLDLAESEASRLGSIYLSIYKRNKGYSIKEQPLETSLVFAYGIHSETVCSSIYGTTYSFMVYTITNIPLLYHILYRIYTIYKCNIYIPYIIYYTITYCTIPYHSIMLFYFYATILLHY